MTEWPSKRGRITKIVPSDGCGRDAVPLVVERWYDFHGFGCHLGNVGYVNVSPNTKKSSGHADALLCV